MPFMHMPFRPPSAKDCEVRHCLLLLPFIAPCSKENAILWMQSHTKLVVASQKVPGAEERAELAARGQRTVTLLKAANTGTSTPAGPLQRAGCELVCSSGGQELWRDCLQSPAAQLAGSRHFAAAALMDGTLQVRPGVVGAHSRAAVTA